MAKECSCMHCRHSRGEVSDEFYKGYLTGRIEVERSDLYELRNLGYKIGSINGEDSIETTMACMECNMTDDKILLDELIGKGLK